MNEEQKFEEMFEQHCRKWKLCMIKDGNTGMYYDMDTLASYSAFQTGYLMGMNFGSKSLGIE